MTSQLSPEKQGFRDFDLPKEHLIDGWHYVSPKTHDRAEAQRRRELRPGTLIAEQQLRGLEVAGIILDSVTEQEGILFAANTIAIAGINSAWYSYAQRSRDVMRRRLKLPIMLHPRSRDADLLLEDSVELLSKSERKAGLLVEQLETNPRRSDDTQRQVGVTTGNAALHLAMYEAVVRGDFPDIAAEESVSDTAMQELARTLALNVLSDARSFYEAASAHPSIAQLADPYSPLGVYWHRKAPGSAQKAVSEALAT